jgi:hypothetical protein
VSGPIWLRWLLTLTGIALAGIRLADLVGSRSGRRGPRAVRGTGFVAAAGVCMPLGMATMASPVGDPTRVRDAALALGALTAGLAVAAWWEVGPAAATALDDWLTVELSAAALVLAALAGHRTGIPVELAAAAPPLSYPCVRTAVRSILRARAGSLLRDGGDLAASGGMIYMLLTIG